MVQGHGSWEGAIRGQLDGGPVLALGRGGIRKSGAGDFGGSDHGPLVDAMVIKDRVAFFHLAKKITGLVVADPVPDHLLFLKKA